MKTVLFILDNYFPYGTAASSRARSLCQLFSLCGYKVHVICSRTFESNVDLHCIFNLPFCTYKVSTGKKLTSIASFVGTPELMQNVEVYLNANNPDIVFAMNSLTYFCKLQKLCKLKKVKLIVEQNEWRDSSSFKLGKLDFRYIREEWLIAKGYRKANGIIAISRFLQNHYLGLGVNTVRIPTILDVKEMQYSLHPFGEKIRIVYTGNPSTSKEFLGPMIKVLLKNPELHERFEFHIYGPDYDKVKKNIGELSYHLEEMRQVVFIHGKIEQEKIRKIIMDADFQLFLRPNRRSSNAGFPTKLGESMSVGTPVITNITGDIGLYLFDDKNGYIVPHSTEDSLSIVLNKVMRMDRNRYISMRKKARETAEKAFDYRNYINEVSRVLITE